MGDCLRYALFDKYFKKLGCRNPADAGGQGYESCHYLLSWYYGWGGAIDESAGWAWRIGCSHVHSGYQNPLAAWALARDELLRPASGSGANDWDKSLSRQLEFYRWLQSEEGAIAGGATNSWLGRYAAPPAGTPTFYGMAYDPQPVYHDPPSNNWFGFQVWTMERLAEYEYVTGDEKAREVLDKWARWAIAQTKLLPDGGYEIPNTLNWRGAPDPWNPARPGPNAALRVKVIDTTADVGVAASLARTLLYHGAAANRAARVNANPARPDAADAPPGRATISLARELLDRMWAKYHDDRGLSAPSLGRIIARFFEQSVAVPAGHSGTMANGGPVPPRRTFLGLTAQVSGRPGLRASEASARRRADADVPLPPLLVQVEIALANAVAADVCGLGADEKGAR